MTINIVINEHPFYFAVDCKIYGATSDEEKKIEELGLHVGGWGGTELRNRITGRSEFDQSIRDICSWGMRNNKSIVIKRVTSV